MVSSAKFLLKLIELQYGDIVRDINREHNRVVDCLGWCIGEVVL